MAKMERKITPQLLLMFQDRHILKQQFNLVENTIGVLILSRDKQQVPKARCKDFPKKVPVNVMTKTQCS